MGHGKLDSILYSYSIPGIDFYPLNPSKNIGSDVLKNKEKGECTVTNLAYDRVQFRTVTYSYSSGVQPGKPGKYYL
jgi:hypothetical protein